MTTSRDKLMLHSSSKRLRFHNSLETQKHGNNGSVVILTTRNHRTLRKQHPITWVVGHLMMGQWTSMTISITYIMDLNAITTASKDSSASMSTTTVTISYKIVRYHNNLETLRLGNNGSSRTSMRMRRKMSKVSSMLTSQDQLVHHSYSKRSRSHNSLEIQMHGETGFFLTSKKTNKTAFKSCFATIFQDMLLSQSGNPHQSWLKL